MPIKRGSTPTTKIYRGSTEILKRFRGLQLVYSSGPGKVRNWRIVPIDVPVDSTVYSETIGFTRSTHNTQALAEAASADWFRTVPSRPSEGWDDIVTSSVIQPRLYNPTGTGTRIYSDIVDDSAGVASTEARANAAIAAYERGISGVIPPPYTHREFTSAVRRQSIGGNNQIIYSNDVDNSEGVENTEAAANAAITAWKNGISVPIENPYTHRDFTSTVVRQAVTTGGVATYSGSIANDAGVVSTKAHADAAVAAFIILNSTGVIPPPYTHRDFTTSVVRQSAGSSKTIYSDTIDNFKGTRSSRSAAEAAIASWKRGIIRPIRNPYTDRDFSSSVTPRTVNSNRTVTSGRTAGSGTASTESAANTAVNNWRSSRRSPSLPYTNRDFDTAVTRRLTSSGGRVYSASRSSSGSASTQDAASAAIDTRRRNISDLGLSSPYTQVHITSAINPRTVSGSSRIYSSTYNSRSGTESTRAAADAKVDAQRTYANSLTPPPPYTSTNFGGRVTAEVTPGRTISSGAVRRGSGQVSGGTDAGLGGAQRAVQSWLMQTPTVPPPYTSYRTHSSITPATGFAAGLSHDWSAWYTFVGTGPATTAYHWSTGYRYSYIRSETVYDWSISYRYSYIRPNTYTYDWVASYQDSYILTTATTVYDWSVSYRYSYVSSSITITYRWSAFYRYYHTPGTAVISYKWTASYRYSRISTTVIIRYGWTTSYRHYRVPVTTLTAYDLVASYRYSRVTTVVTITYEARWLAPSTGIFTNYRIEHTALDGTPLDDVLIDPAVLGYAIGTTLQRLRIRVERPLDMVVGPWSDWI